MSGDVSGVVIAGTSEVVAGSELRGAVVDAENLILQLAAWSHTAFLVPAGGG